MQEQNPNHADGWRKRGLNRIEQVLNTFFQPGESRLARLMAVVWLAVLLLYGVRLWNFFYSGGNIYFDFLDWGEVAGPRYALLRDAAVKGVLPLHAGDMTGLRGVTDRYFSIADTPFSPQYLLLPYLDLGRYIFYDTLLFYILGFTGLVLIYRKYRLSPFTFTLLFVLLNFNGFLVSHLAAGHTNWIVTFLLPYAVLLFFELIEKQRATWGWVLAFSLLELVILLQGGFHFYLWILFYLAVLALFNWRLIKPALLGGVFAVLLGLPRLLPPALALEGVDNPYLGGFSSVADLFDNLVTLRDPARAVRAVTDTFPLNGWELDFYIGWLGLAVLVGFGLLLPLFRSRAKSSFQVQVLVTSLILGVFSIGEMYAKILAVLPVPPLTGERVTSRMFILPLVSLLALAVIFLQRELDRRRLPAWAQVLNLLLTYLVFHDLYQHLQAWRIRYLDSMVDLFPKVPFDPTLHLIANHPDPLYVGLLAGGALVAFLALIFLVSMALRKKQGQASFIFSDRG